MSFRFAEHYLATRKKLGTLLKLLDKLAHKSHIKVEGLLEMCHELDRPMRIMICGDAGVERSEVISTLLGTKVSLKAKTWSAVDFSGQESEESLQMPVKRGKEPSLQDVLCIESPPCNELKPEDEQFFKSLIAESDIILWIFSVDNPWSAATWGRIEALPRELIDQSVLILNKVDERDPQDIEVMLGHMSDLSSQRLQTVQKIFPVSNNKKETAGYEVFWDRVNYLLEHSYKRNQFLLQVRDKLHRVLDQLEETMDKRVIALDGDRGFLSSLEADIDRQREREIQLYAGRGVNLNKEFIDEIDPMLEALHTQCGLFSSLIDLFGKGKLVSNVEKFFIDRVSSRFVQRSRSDCMQILLDCKEQWRSMQEHLEERLGSDVGDFQQEAFKKMLPELEMKQEKMARTVILGMKLKQTMEYLVEPRRRKLKKILSSALIGFIIAGLLGTFKVPPSGAPALVVFILSLLILAYFTYAALSTRKSIVTAMADRMVDLRADFREGVFESYQYMIREFFTGYTPMFETMRRQIAEAKMNLEPLQKEHHNLFLEFKAVESEVLERVQ